MSATPTIVCPVDFSDASRSALRGASALADHIGAAVIVLTVEDPLLAAASRRAQARPTLAEQTESELRRFCTEALGNPATGPKTIRFQVAVGKPAPEILRVSRETDADLIVISSRGASGVRKLFFGSTTERVLRETSVPVLITPAEGPVPTSLPDITTHISRVMAPVDLTPASPRQVTVAAGIADALSVPLIVAHVVEPAFIPAAWRNALPGADSARRAEAEEELQRIIGSLPARVPTESLLVTGEPSEEIVKCAQVRGSNLIVMGLHAGGTFGPRVGSVTYRVLCLTRALVLALPPVTEGMPAQRQRRYEWTKAGQGR